MGVATLGSTLNAGLELVGSCQRCDRPVRNDTPALIGLAERYGREAVLYDIMQRVTCADCGAKVDLTVNPTRHMPRPPP